MAGSKTDNDYFTVLHYVRITMQSTSHELKSSGIVPNRGTNSTSSVEKNCDFRLAILSRKRYEIGSELI